MIINYHCENCDVDFNTIGEDYRDNNGNLCCPYCGEQVDYV